MKLYGSRRWRVGLVSLVTALAIAVSTSSGAVEDSDKMRGLRAAFVLKFMRFTQWPPESFQGQTDPIEVAVLGADVAAALELVVRGAHVHGRAVTVRTLQPPPANGKEADRQAWLASLRRAHVLYIDTEHKDHVDELLAAVQGMNVLTIGATPKFAARGGMLGLVLDRGRYAFEANVQAISATRIKVSSHVLDLAKIVKERR